MESINARSLRARKARWGSRLGKAGYVFLLAIVLCGAIGGAFGIAAGLNIGWSMLGIAMLAAMPALWYRYDLSIVPVQGHDLNGRLAVDVLKRLDTRGEYTPQTLWQDLKSHWQVAFFSNHLLLPSELIEQQLSTDVHALPVALQQAVAVADQAGSETIEPGHLAMALLSTSPQIGALLTHARLTEQDLLNINGWLNRDIVLIRRPRQSFGGIGRDWANGYTPRLNQFGHNLSLEIEHGARNLNSLVNSAGVLSIKSAFSQGASAIALIGPDGIGKTTNAYALAHNLLAENHDPRLQHRQIISLSPSAIISAARQQGDLEYIVNSLMNEAVHAGNIILFMDDAQLFFENGPGQFNATHILLPVIQNRAVQLVLAMSPRDYQNLRANNTAFAGLLTPVVLQEPPEQQTLDIMADNATRFELKHKVLVSYEAIKEAYRLSGRYEADMAYPGKAIRLLEQALTHSEHNVITAASVQRAIEQTTGVKAGSAAPVEATQLLSLEDQIHKRMINQSRAVSVVANALRRARAGVSNPNRPIGSFLFLGPTGVGKTELAKSIAATYFGDENSMIRMDMSEYQQQTDVSRLLANGQGETSSLIMRIRERPFSVVLLDEIEKAHPNILNLLLQLLDEGHLTDTTGRAASFKDAIVIATSNAGADAIRARIEHGEELESFEREFTDQLINSGQFRPELLNRFDEIVLFRPLKPEELAQVVRLMVGGINKTLATQNLSVELTDAAVEKIVAIGNDPRLGARPMRRALQRAVEDTIAQKILRQEVHPGDHIHLDGPDLVL